MRFIDMTAAEQNLVLSDNGMIRTPLQQKAVLIAEQKQLPEPNVEPALWSKVGKHIVVSKPCKLTQKQVAEMVLAFSA